MNAKQMAAEKAIEYVEDGMVVGLGTGSTAGYAIKAIGNLVRSGMQLKAMASSLASERLALEYGIQLVDSLEITRIDVTIDGADEVDRHHNLIKGGGGALLREKILAYNSKYFIVIVDESKLVTQLGKFPLPVEIVPFAATIILQQIKAIGCEAGIRQRNGENFITDNGNLIVDCAFFQIPDPEVLDTRIKTIPGVVETGLFAASKVSRIIAGSSDGNVQILS